ncbi:MAG: hypothetical protein GF331_00875 [Chitinivibrionales bacterium]|nr:hypothetical protein [Chitinivibrionales bacterium]
MKKRDLAILVLLLGGLTLSGHAQRTVAYGRTVTVRASSTTGTGHGKFGIIQRYDIRNNQASSYGTIYNGGNARCANISPDGNRVAFLRSDNKICIVNIDGSGSVQVLGDIMDAASGWIDWPMQEWIYISPNFGRNGLHRINVGTGQRQNLGDLRVDKTWTLSVSRDGTRACISANDGGWTSHIVTISNNQVSSVQQVGACGGSISPDGSLYTLNVSDHVTCHVKRFDDQSSYKSWQTSRCSSAGSNWNRHRWSSNSDDWVTFTQGAPYQMENYHNQVLYYVPDGGQTRIQVTNNGNGVYNEGDDFWIQQHDEPSIGLNPSSLEFDAEVGGTAPSPQTVTVRNVGTGTLPSLNASSNRAWLQVSLQGSGNEHTITNSVNLGGVAGGVYTATVTVSGNGVQSAAYTVELTVVAPPVLTTVAANDAYVPPGGTVQCSATALDQYGEPMSPQPDFSWSVVSGGGSITAAGVFTAPSSEGSVTVRASAGGVHDDATVAVSNAPPVHLKIDCAASPVSGWESDAGYLTEGNDWVSDWSFDNTVDLSGVPDPAPHDVYPTAPLSQTRNAYSFGDLPNGTYRVRLHFVLGSGHTGTFKMDYTIEGNKVLDDFDIKTDAGGYDKGVVKEFSVVVDDGDGLGIVGENDGGISVFVSAIEIIGEATAPSGPALTVLSPNGAESFTAGETVTFRWRGDTERVTGVTVAVSLDEGESWSTISGETSIAAFEGDTDTGSFTWQVPSTLEGKSIASTNCLVRVRDYMDLSLVDVSDGAFTLAAAQAVAGLSRPAPYDRHAPYRHGRAVAHARVYDLRGVRLDRRGGPLPTPARASRVLIIERRDGPRRSYDAVLVQE